MFDIETVDDAGRVDVQGERMWVLVRERRGHVYLGVLDNEPACVEPDDDGSLHRGAEVPFAAEHVIDIAEPPTAYLEERLRDPPSRRWAPGARP